MNHRANISIAGAFPFLAVGALAVLLHLACGERAAEKHGAAAKVVSPPSESPVPDAPQRTGEKPETRPSLHAVEWPEAGREWVQCEESEADTVMVLEYTVKGFQNVPRFETPLRLPNAQEAFETQIIGTSSYGDGGPAGPGAGTGFGHSFWMQENATPGVTFEVSLYWTAPEHTRGDIHQTITAAVGKESDHRLSDSCNLHVTYRRPLPSRVRP